MTAAPAALALSRGATGKLIDRPKQGIPIGCWLRGLLCAWPEGLLAERCLREEGIFEYSHVCRVWNEHLKGRYRQYQSRSILMFHTWLKAWA